MRGVQLQIEALLLLVGCAPFPALRSAAVTPGFSMSAASRINMSVGPELAWFYSGLSECQSDCSDNPVVLDLAVHYGWFFTPSEKHGIELVAGSKGLDPYAGLHLQAIGTRILTIGGGAHVSALGGRLLYMNADIVLSSKLRILFEPQTASRHLRNTGARVAVFGAVGGIAFDMSRASVIAGFGMFEGRGSRPGWDPEEFSTTFSAAMFSVIVGNTRRPLAGE